MPPVRTAARTHGATPTRWIRSSIRPGISPVSPIRGTRWRRRRLRSWTAAKAGCRSTSISAASSTRFCTCSIRASYVRAMKATGHMNDVEEPFEGLFTQGMVVHETYKGRGRLGDAGGGRGRARRTARAARHCSRPARRSRSARSRRCRSRGKMSSTPTTSSPATAPTRRAGSCCRIRRRSAT